MAPRMKVEVDASTPNDAGQSAPKPKVAAPKATVETPAAPVSETRPATTPAPAAAPKPRVESQPAASSNAAASSAPQAAAQQAAPKPKVSVVPPASPEQEYTYEANAGTQQQSAGNEQYVPQDPYPVQEAQPAQEPPQQKRTIGDTRRAASGWVHSTFPGHEHAFYGGLIALFTALLIFIIGPLHVLLIYVLIIVGIAIGQFFDGDPKIIRMVSDLFNGNREQR